MTSQHGGWNCAIYFHPSAELLPTYCPLLPTTADYCPLQPTTAESLFFEFTPAMFILKFLFWDYHFFADEASKQVSERLVISKKNNTSIPFSIVFEITPGAPVFVSLN